MEMGMLLKEQPKLNWNVVLKDQEELTIQDLKKRIRSTVKRPVSEDEMLIWLIQGVEDKSIVATLSYKLNTKCSKALA